MTGVPDRVVVADENGEREMSAEEFLRQPLTSRVRWLIEDRVRFYCGDRWMAPSVALRRLLDASRPGV